jgi:hypothetical protein
MGASVELGMGIEPIPEWRYFGFWLKISCPSRKFLRMWKIIKTVEFPFKVSFS